MRIGLVGCVKKKGPVAAPAGELYVSPLFVGRRRFVESSCDRWFILSALHGLLDPTELTQPYDQSLVDVSTGERQAWSEEVLGSLDKALGDVTGVVFEIHAGAAYRDFGLIDGLRRRGAEVVVPAAGLSQGQQLAFYNGAAVVPKSTPRLSGTAPTVHASSGYAPLGEWLSARDDRRVAVSFVELERLLGRPLPASAGRHRPWWGNNERSPQAAAWLGAGWRVAAVDLATRKVTFQKSDP